MRAAQYPDQGHAVILYDRLFYINTQVWKSQQLVLHRTTYRLRPLQWLPLVDVSPYKISVVAIRNSLRIMSIPRVYNFRNQLPGA